MTVRLLYSVEQPELPSRRQATMSTEKRGFGFRRFKKSWRPRATRAKARCLNQNWQSLAYKAQRSDHWAKTANLRYHYVKQCGLCSWIAKKNKLQPENMLVCCYCSPTLALSPTMKIWLGVINEMCLQGLNLSSTQKLALHHDSALLQPAMNAVGLCSLIKWKHKRSRMIGWSQVKRFQHQNGVRKAYQLIAKHALLFELRFCDLRIAPITKHLLVQASDFFNPLVLLKCFYAQCD